MPHGMCYLWQPRILGLHVLSDAMIALAYFSIPFTLVYFVVKRTDLRFTSIFVCFAVFIVACGTTHLMEIVTIWWPAYWLSGGIKAVTALASIPTAILLAKLVPIALRVPSPSALQGANSALAREVLDRKNAEEKVRLVNASLEARVAERTAQLAAANITLTKINARFALASNAARLGFWELHLSNNTFEWDDSMFRLHGRPRHGGTQPFAAWAEILHPDDRKASERAMSESRSGDGSFEQEYRVVCQNGEIRHLRCAFGVTRDERGVAIQLYGVAFDITEQKRATEQFRLALEAAPTGMLMMDRAGIMVLVNAQIEVLFGYPRDELLGRRIEMLVPERFRAHHPDLRSAFFGDPKTRVMGAGRELYGLRKDGTEVPVEIGLNPLQTSEGYFVLSSIADITERKRASEVQQQMTALVESASDAILTKSLEGIIRSWNPAAEHLLGYAAEEIVGQPVTCLIPGDRQDEESGILDQIKSGRGITNLETVRRRKDGSSVDVSLTISPVFGSGGKVVCASKIMRDITPQRQAAATLRALNSELEQRVSARTAELKERESLLQEVHHRVKNNLQVISSLISMQIRSIADVSTRRALQECQSRVETMAQIHEMLYQAKDYARVPFSRYTTDLVNRVISASGVSSTAVTVDFHLEDLSLSVDKAIPCGLILNELVSNALKHAFPNESSGEIRVELRQLPDRQVLLSVSDDGVGISPDFEPEKSKSLGVQLVITLVEQLDAHLDIIRQPGTTFRIIFSTEPNK